MYLCTRYIVLISQYITDRSCYKPVSVKDYICLGSKHEQLGNMENIAKNVCVYVMPHQQLSSYGDRATASSLI